MWSLEKSTVGLVRGILSLIYCYVMIGLAFYEPVGYVSAWELGLLNAPGSNMGGDGRSVVGNIDILL